jgi:hypothetical protein
MVRWLSPGQLTSTAIRALLSGIFGSYADRREVQAALHQTDRMDELDPNCAPLRDLIHRYDDRGDPEHGFWIDFVADLGDGFDPTYTVAWLLAQPSLPVPAAGATAAVDGSGAGASKRHTRRGHILIMGGDQVYPTPSRDEYTNRLAGPYEAALPWTTEKPPPHLYAIPGNHDWYDGLTAFLRLFCQRRWIGGWKTQQHRSYFALQLPHRWWLLGIDAQLEADIDQPQRDYFCRVARQMRPGDRVILCTAAPAWVHTEADPAAFDNLAFFERTVLEPAGVELAVTLTGDLHHYSRYAAGGAQGGGHHKITAGGGGAYLVGTRLLPDTLRLRSPAGDDPEPYIRKAQYPSARTSLGLRWGALLLAVKNPSFALFLGLMYALFAWFLQSSSKLFMPLRAWGPEQRRYPDFMTFASVRGPDQWRDVLDAVWLATAHSPLVVTFSLLVIGGLIAFCAPDVERSRLLRKSRRLRTGVRGGAGLVHGLLHLALAVGMIWLLSWLNLVVAGLRVDDPAQVGMFLLEMALVGGILGALLMSLFLLPGINYNEAFSAQHLEGYKNFVRLHVGADGTLTVYPYGVDRVVPWRFRPNAPPEAPWFTPVRAPMVRLIEDPITLAAAPAP